MRLNVIAGSRQVWQAKCDAISREESQKMEYLVTFVGGIGVGCVSCFLYIRVLKAKINSYEFFIHNRLDHWTSRLFH